MNNSNTLADETLMAFADGELDAAQHTQVESALQADPALRQRVNEMKQQNARVGAAFAAVLDEPVPDRLTRLLQTPSVAPAPVVVQLSDVRAERIRPRTMPTWAQLGGMAASVVLGVVLGARFLGSGLDPAMGLNQGQLVAGGAIDKALSTQLASEPFAGGPVAVQLSFVDKRGHYCRTFSTAAVAGLACQEAGQWLVQQVTVVDTQASRTVRQAAITLPPALLSAVDIRMANGTLDAAAERQARAQAWRK
ncbi:MAG: hypothetical protein V4627_13430 [Pseudomonadota bacterium]